MQETARGKELSMFLRFRSLLVGAVAATGFLAVSCSTKPPAQVAPPPPTHTPTIVRLEPTPAPTPAPSRVAEDALPTSVDEINRRGYLKDAFFELDKYAIEPTQRDALAGDATWLRAHPG